jgi:hypothetical protein
MNGAIPLFHLYFFMTRTGKKNYFHLILAKGNPKLYWSNRAPMTWTSVCWGTISPSKRPTCIDNVTARTHLRRIHTYHAVPVPCHSAPGLESVLPIWFTQCGRVWVTHVMPFPCRSPAMPRICRSESDFSWPRQGRGRGTAWVRHGMCELASAVQRRHVGDMPAFSFFRLPRGVPGMLLSEAYQSQMQVAGVKQSNVYHGRGEANYEVFWCTNMSDCIIYSTKIMITI